MGRAISARPYFVTLYVVGRVLDAESGRRASLRANGGSTLMGMGDTREVLRSAGRLREASSASWGGAQRVVFVTLLVALGWFATAASARAATGVPTEVSGTITWTTTYSGGETGKDAGKIKFDTSKNVPASDGTCFLGSCDALASITAAHSYFAGDSCSAGGYPAHYKDDEGSGTNLGEIGWSGRTTGHFPFPMSLTLNPDGWGDVAGNETTYQCDGTSSTDAAGQGVPWTVPCSWKNPTFPFEVDGMRNGTSHVTGARDCSYSGPDTGVTVHTHASWDVVVAYGTAGDESNWSIVGKGICDVALPEASGGAGFAGLALTGLAARASGIGGIVLGVGAAGCSLLEHRQSSSALAETACATASATSAVSGGFALVTSETGVGAIVGGITSLVTGAIADVACAKDPPLPSYRTIAKPTVPRLHWTAPQGVAKPVGAALAKLVSNALAIGAYGGAAILCMDRATGARKARAMQWLARQQKCAARYSADVAGLYRAGIRIRRALLHALTSTHAPDPALPAARDVAALLNRQSSAGTPAGISAADIRFAKLTLARRGFTLGKAPAHLDDAVAGAAVLRALSDAARAFDHDAAAER